jgi:hypothetical protein
MKTSESESDVTTVPLKPVAVLIILLVIGLAVSIFLGNYFYRNKACKPDCSTCTPDCTRCPCTPSNPSNPSNPDCPICPICLPPNDPVECAVCPPPCPPPCPPCPEPAPETPPRWYMKNGLGLIPTGLDPPNASGHEVKISAETDTLDKALAWVRAKGGVMLSYPFYPPQLGWSMYWQTVTGGTPDGNALFQSYEWK